ncbi:hypothetical protein AGLY_012739 [Aphis glycines]|uniref:Cell division cycle protein 27 homolog n=1 Tax=Aphis glycines TaxID=307491 RepID=A0A6G0T933_APHGL|nr:hypothetical protein AGLY_012739 [Aphis glycines]
MFYSKYSDSDAPISIITEILSENNPIKFENISNQFKALRFTKVKHLAQATLEKASLIKLSGNSSTLLYRAFEMYDKHLGEIKILRLQPDAYTVRNNYGKFLLSQNKVENAKQQFKIAQKSANNCEALSYLGDVYFMTKKYDKAIFKYHKALEIKPNLKITLFNLGKVYLQITEYQKAVEAFEKTIKLDSENAAALRYLAIAYCHLDNMLKSVETYKRCLELLPDDLESNLELGLVYYHNLNKCHEAENCFKKCIQLSPEREDLYKNLLEVYQQLNKRIDASNVFMTLGDLFLKKSDLENARNAFTSALFLNPINADGHWKLGRTMHKLGHYDLAIIRYKKADQ